MELASISFLMGKLLFASPTKTSKDSTLVVSRPTSLGLLSLFQTVVGHLS